MDLRVGVIFTFVMLHKQLTPSYNKTIGETIKNQCISQLAHNSTKVYKEQK